ncbi:ABC transporter permease [Streptomyces sp. 5K101]|uniref:ABC transporter permease n=1 Tax=Streptomyces sp. 5K101 TaxID=3390037 RepID=UPI003975DC44
MIWYLLRRVLQAVFVVWAAYTLTFTVLFMLPSDPVAIMLGASSGGETTGIDPVQIAALRAEYGFDQPVVVQYLTMLGDALRGDFGQSILTGARVAERIATELPHTLALGGLALVLAVTLGFTVGMLSIYPRMRVVRSALTALPPLGIAVPSFWLGILLIQQVSFGWGLLPATGNEGFASLVLPALTMAVPTGAILAQVFAASLRATLAEPYIDVVRAKGASRARIFYGHAIRNATLPTMTLVGLLVGNLVGGAAIAETIFGRSGIGRLTVQAVSNQDIPMVQGVVMLAAVATVTVTLVVDLIYPLIDPRVRTRSAAQ